MNKDINFPRKQRGCTDIFFFLLFVLLWTAVGFVSWQAGQYGNPWHLIYPMNTQGHLCGFSSDSNGDFSNLPYLYLLNPARSNSASICVSSCPDTSRPTASYSNITNYCVEGISNPSNASFVYYQNLNLCSTFVYASAPKYSRCLPADGNAAQFIATSNPSVSYDTAMANMVTAFDLNDEALNIIYDFGRTWIWILAACGFSAVLSLLVVLFLRYSGRFMIPALSVFALLCVHGMVVFFVFAWIFASTDASNTPVATSNYNREQQAYFGMFIASAIVVGFVNLVHVFIIRKIRVSAGIFRESQKAIAALPTIPLFPIIMTILFTGLVALWLFFEFFVVTVTSNPDLFGFQYDPVNLKYFQWLVLFVAFWTYQVFYGLTVTTISGATATWYWSADKLAIESGAVRKSFGRALFWHSGSMAFAGLFLPIFSPLRTIGAALSRGPTPETKTGSKALFRPFKCCFSCFSEIFLYINKNAYVDIALLGFNFCKSSQKAGLILARNAFRLSGLSTFADFLLFLIRVSISAALGASGYFWIKYYYYGNPLYFSASTVFMIMICSYGVASLFTPIFSATIDTILISFCEDSEINDGSYDKPYFASEELQKLTNIKNIRLNMKNQVAPSEMMEAELSNREAFLEDV